MTKGMTDTRSVGRGIVTMAFGSPWYHRMAHGLLKSIRTHSSNVQLGIITDDPDTKAGKLADHVITLDPDYGVGVVQKLFLDKYSPFDETLFIDSDCLIYGDVNALWSKYAVGIPFGVMCERYIYKHDSHVSIKSVDTFLDILNIAKIPLFNGGIYYFNRSGDASKIFACARSIYAKKRDIGLLEFKGAPAADEPVFAAAIELLGIDVLPSDNRKTMSDVHEDVLGLSSLDVTRGVSMHTYKGNVYSPLIVHFNYSAQECFVYRRELNRLRLPRRARVLASIDAALEVLPIIVRKKWRHYRERISVRVREVGIMGLIPERILLRTRKQTR